MNRVFQFVVLIFAVCIFASPEAKAQESAEEFSMESLLDPSSDLRFYLDQIIDGSSIQVPDIHLFVVFYGEDKSEYEYFLLTKHVEDPFLDEVETNVYRGTNLVRLNEVDSLELVGLADQIRGDLFHFFRESEPYAPDFLEASVNRQMNCLVIMRQTDHSPLVGGMIISPSDGSQADESWNQLRALFE